MSVVDGLADLHLASVDGDRLATAEAVLKTDPVDSAAIKTKLVALIRLDKYDAALKFVAHLGEKADSYPDELAYVFYRAGRLEALRELAERVTKPGVVLSLAQAEYRAGNLDRAQALFDAIKLPAEEQEDLAVNIAAIRALQGQYTTESDAFDHSFNGAYSLVVSGQLDQALNKLHEAKQNARDKDEAQSTVVQAALVHQLKGDTTQAKTLLETIDLAHVSDKALVQLIENNRLLLQNIETMEGAQEALLIYDTLADGLIPAQKVLIESNRLCLQALAGRNIASGANKFVQHYPVCVTPQVAAAFQASKHDVAALQRLVAREPTNVGAALALAQLLSVNDAKRASSTVRGLYEVVAANTKDITPGLAGATVAGLRYLSDDNAKAVYDVLSHLKPVGDVALPLAELACSGNPVHVKQAEKYFDHLPNHLIAAAGLAAGAPASVDLSRVDATLPSIDSLIKGVDADALENEGFQRLVRRSVVIPSGISKPRKARKRKLPKSYDPATTPDPERWLAKQDRSNYKPKRKKNAQATQGSSQGSAQGAAPSAPVVTSATKPKAKKKKGKKK